MDSIHISTAESLKYLINYYAEEECHYQLAIVTLYLINLILLFRLMHTVAILSKFEGPMSYVKQLPLEGSLTHCSLVSPYGS